MQRRTWLKSATGAIASRFILSDARAQSSQGFRTFQLLLNDTGEHRATRIVDAFLYDGNICYLARESDDIESLHKIGCTSSTGEFVWRRRLPLGLYRGIGMSEDGNLLIVSVSSLYKGNPPNSVYCVVPGNSNPPQVARLLAVPSISNRDVAFVEGKHFGSVSNGVSMSVTTLESARRGQVPAIYSLSLPAFRSFEILERGGSVLIVNNETAEVGVYDSASGTYSQKTVSGSAMSLAKASIRKNLEGVAMPANSWMNLIMASGVINNSVQFLLAPTRESGHVCVVRCCFHCHWCKSDRFVASAGPVAV